MAAAAAAATAAAAGRLLDRRPVGSRSSDDKRGVLTAREVRDQGDDVPADG